MEISKDIAEIDFDWTDSNTIVIDNKGQPSDAGTTVLINYNQIIFLTPLTAQQLERFKRVVNEAVDHELSKRKTK